MKAQRLVLMIQFAVDNVPAGLAILYFPHAHVHEALGYWRSGEKSGMSVWI